MADSLRKIPSVSVVKFASSSGSREVERLPVSPLPQEAEEVPEEIRICGNHSQGTRGKGKETEQLDGGEALKQGPPLC